MNGTAKKITTMAMLSAMAFVAMVCIHISLMPAAPFLTYDPKDVIIVIGGFMFGPLASIAISVITALAEMMTVSTTGVIGMIMNVLSSVGFAAVASGIYSRKRTLNGAVLGLSCGVAVMTAVMLLWNYLITPIYMGMPRPAVAAMLVPVFLPFNLIKGGINAALVMLIYKPVVTALRKAGLVPSGSGTGGKLNIGVIAASALILAGLVCAVIVMN